MNEELCIATTGQVWVHTVGADPGCAGSCTDTSGADVVAATKSACTTDTTHTWEYGSLTCVERVWGCTFDRFWTFKEEYNTMCDYTDGFWNEAPDGCDICTNGGCTVTTATNFDSEVVDDYAREELCVFEEAAPVYLGKTVDSTKFPDPAAVFVQGSVAQKLFKCAVRADICLGLNLITQAEFDNSELPGQGCTANTACQEQVVVRGVTVDSGGRRRVQEEGTSRRRLQSAATVDVALIPADGGASSQALQASVANALASADGYGAVVPGVVEFGGCTISTAKNFDSGATRDDGTCVWSVDVPEAVAGVSIFFTGVTGTSATVNWAEPRLGGYKAPIVGYKLLMRTGSTSDFVETESDVDTFAYTDISAYTGFVELAGVFTEAFCSNPSALTQDECGQIAGATWTAASRSHTAYGLTPGVYYFFKVKAYNVFGEATAWSTASYGLRPHTVPAQTVVAVSSVTQTSPTQVDLTWSAPATLGTVACAGTQYLSAKDLTSAAETCTTAGTGSPVTAYRIRISTDGGTTYTNVAAASALASSVASHTVTGLQPNTQYTFMVVASNAIGESSLTAHPTLTVTTLGVPAASSAPVALSVDANSITLQLLKPSSTSTLQSYRLFASSWNPATGAWQPAARAGIGAYSFGDRDNKWTEGPMDPTTYFEAASNSVALPGTLSTSEWLEIKPPASYDPTSASDNTVTVESLQSGTKYKFVTTFTNLAGESAVSSESLAFYTLDGAIDDLEIMSGPPCIYQDGRKTTFTASSSGSNVRYRWEREDGSELGTCVSDSTTPTADSDTHYGTQPRYSSHECRVVEHTFVSLGTQTISVVASNSRGNQRATRVYNVNYCGCTDVFDTTNHWPAATYTLPRECAVESWNEAKDTVQAGEVQYYQFYYEESTHSVDLTLRVDTGQVNMLVSADGLPEVGVSASYLAVPYSASSISNFYVASIPFEHLSTHRSLYVAVHGVSKFSRFELLAHKKDFATARSLLADDSVLASPSPVLTGRSVFYEYVFSEAPNDVDVEVTVVVLTGKLTVFTSKTERYPSPKRSLGGTDLGYWKASATTDAGSTATLVHTVQPAHDPRRLYVSIRGDAANVDPSAPTGSNLDVGAALGQSTYTIKAKVYRYRLESELLDVANGDSSEERRYSTVDTGNFNYYEVLVSSSTKSVTVTLDRHSGSVQLFHSDTKLPTRDLSIGYSGKYPTSTVAWSSGTPATLTVPISFSMINKNSLKVYLGVYGLQAASYGISVAATALPGAASAPNAIPFETAFSGPLTASLTADTYYFMAVPVGPEDVAMSVPTRSGAGSRTDDLTSSQDTWGTDWYEPLTATWKANHEDEHDLDVSLTLGMSTASSDVQVYGSSREVYVSPERGYDVSATVSAAGATQSIAVPHYTFGDQIVYLSLLSTTTQDVVFTLTKVQQTASVTTDTATVRDTCAALNACSGRGSCVTESGTSICYCDEDYTGDDCSVEAFMGSASDENPQLALPSVIMGHTVTNGVVATAYDESVSITVPYEVRNAPAYAKVRIRVDGKPYPDRMSGVKHIGAGGTPKEGSQTYYTANLIDLVPQVDHVLQLYLTSADGTLLDATEVSFQTKRSGGCSPDSGGACSGNGLCHNGYCICYDGFIGTECAVSDPTQGTDPATGAKSYTSAGAGFEPTAAFKTYKTMETKNKQDKTTLANTLRLEAAKAELLQLATSRAAKSLETRTKIESTQDDVAAQKLSTKLSIDTKVEALHRKLDANAAAIQQDLLSAERAKTANLEHHIETQRALFNHQTAVQNRLDKDRAATATLKASRQADVDKALADNQFVLNQLLLSNGPPVQISELTTESCTTNQFNELECVQVDNSAAFQSDAASVTDHESIARGR
jgi:hypothetical protein